MGRASAEKAFGLSAAPTIVPEGGLEAMPTPVSISAFPVRGYSIAKDVVGVKILVQSPLVIAGRPSSAWEDHNYKSLPKVTGGNLLRSRVTFGHCRTHEEG